MSRTALTALGAATFGCLMVGGYGLAMVASGFRLLPEAVAANGLPPALHLHILTASIALVLLPWQLMAPIRRRLPRVHRWTGRGYVVAATLGGLSGVAAAVTTVNGDSAALGFSLLGLLWTGSTLAMYLAARRRDFAAHRRWAIRSFALAFAAVTLRFYLPVALALGLSFPDSYAVIAWLSWVPNLILAERWASRVTRRAGHGTPARVAGAARLESYPPT